MRIAVISDTHNHFPSRLPALVAGADEIWHLGDVCDPAVLVEFEQLGPPLRVVLGNNDSHPWPLVLRLEIHGVRCHLQHIPPARAPRDCDLVLHGHTHVPRDETICGARWLNPGCISHPRGQGLSFAWLAIGAGRAIHWQAMPL
jgi:putative phosphoesterase